MCICGNRGLARNLPELGATGADEIEGTGYYKKERQSERVRKIYVKICCSLSG
jgi:hypothetical protein